MAKRSPTGATSNGGSTAAPAERHKKFLEENEEWDRQVEESLEDLKRLAGEEEAGETSPATKDPAGV